MSCARYLAAALCGAIAFGALAEPAEIERALEQAERSLAIGDVAGAATSIERTAASHAPAVEVTLVRVHMQAGEYARALALAGHVAGEHADYPAATALYAWLLDVGGQRQIARRLLETAGTHETVEAVRERLAAQWPVADGPLLVPPVRFGPYASDDIAGGEVIASATLVDGGRRALAPAGALHGRAASAIWLRNGLGHTTVATVERHVSVGVEELAVLQLQRPLRMPPELLAAGRSPFAGSVGYAVEFAPTPGSADAAWPLLELGFFGRASSDVELPLLGIDVPPSAHGGPVFDEAGRLVGLALRAADGRDRLVSAATLPADVGKLFGTPTPGGPTPRSAVDAIYERALLLTLQMITTRSP